MIREARSSQASFLSYRFLISSYFILSDWASFLSRSSDSWLRGRDPFPLGDLFEDEPGLYFVLGPGLNGRQHLVGLGLHHFQRKTLGAQPHFRVADDIEALGLDEGRRRLDGVLVDEPLYDTAADRLVFPLGGGVFEPLPDVILERLEVLELADILGKLVVDLRDVLDPNLLDIDFKL